MQARRNPARPDPILPRGQSEGPSRSLHTALHMAGRTVRITHVPSGDLLAEGPVGWGITPFEGNWYIGRRWLRTHGFRTTGIPGLCPYKFIYLWVDYHASDGTRERALGWKYVLPNPLLPFIAFRVAVPGAHPALRVEVTEA